MTLIALEPILASLRAWATERSLEIQTGILELGSSFPEVTVVGFSPEDLTLFLSLANALPAAIVAIDAPVLGEEDLRLATALTVDLKGGNLRSLYRQTIEDAQAHLGKVREVTAIAFAPGIARAVVFRAATDWGEALFSIVDELKSE